MLKKAIHIIFVVALTSACTSRPDEILSSNEMRMILVDLHKAEAIVSINNYSYREEDKEKLCYQYVLQKHGVTQAEFDSAVVWYTNYPTMFELIYERVQADVQKENNELEALIRSIEAMTEKANRAPLKLDFIDSTIVSHYGLCSPEPYKRFAGAILDSCILKLPENKVRTYVYPIGFVDSTYVNNDSIKIFNDSLKITIDSVKSEVNNNSPKKLTTFRRGMKLKKVVK